jgi:hypothetical protein
MAKTRSTSTSFSVDYRLTDATYGHHPSYTKCLHALGLGSSRLRALRGRTGDPLRACVADANGPFGGTPERLELRVAWLARGGTVL